MSECISLQSENKFFLVATWYSYTIDSACEHFVDNFCIRVCRQGDLCLSSSVLSLASSVCVRLCQPRLRRHTAMFFLEGSQTSLHCWLFCIWCELMFVYTCGYPTPFVKDTVLSPVNGLGAFVKNQLTVGSKFISRLSVLFHWSLY